MAITPEETLEIFEDTGAFLRGHFLLTSGLHSGEYMQCARVLQHPDIAERFGQELSRSLLNIVNAPVNVVVAPAMGGLIIGHEVARAFGVRFIFTERDPATRRMQLRRGFAVEQGEQAVVVEDVITTGGSSREVVELLLSLGATVAGAASIMDRSGGVASVGVPRVALATLSATTWPEEDCPMCREGVPVVKPGSRPA